MPVYSTASTRHIATGPGPGPAPIRRITGASLAWNGERRHADLDLDGEVIGARSRAGQSAGVGVDVGVDLDLSGHLVFPGLVNAHDHLHLNVFGPMRPRKRYAHSMDWVDDMAGAIESEAARSLRAVPIEARAWHGALKNVLAGTTTVVHHDPWLPVFEHPDFPVTVVRDIGWAHSLGMAGRYGPEIAESLAATSADRPWFIHLAEGTDVRAGAELADLDRSGGLEPRTRLIHAVGLGRADVDRALAAGASMVWCPASNDFLLGSVADPRPFVTAGRAGLGTDSRLTGARDLLDEMRFAVRAELCPFGELLALVTHIGARCAGRPDAGCLTAGAPADMLAIRDDGRPPAEQLAAARRADLRLVIARGRPVVADADLAWVFAESGVSVVQIVVDGCPKVIARTTIEPVWAAGIAEPGVEVPASEEHDHAAAGGVLAQVTHVDREFPS